MKEAKDNGNSVEVKLTCNIDGSDSDEVDATKIKYSNKKWSWDVNHHLGCSAFPLDVFMEKYKILVTVIFIIVGLLCAFCGSKLFKPVLFIIGTILVTGLMFIIFYQFWLLKNVDNVQRNFIIALVISGVFGITAGVLLVIFERFCFVVVGGALGAFGGLLLYSAIFAGFTPGVTLFNNL